jgi:hypothetical protein
MRPLSLLFADGNASGERRPHHLGDIGGEPLRRSDGLERGAGVSLTPGIVFFPALLQLLEYIKEDGTYLPKSVLHADLDLGMLEFVKEKLKTTVSGKDINVVDKIITNQRWSQFTGKKRRRNYPPQETSCSKDYPETHDPYTG